MGTEDTGRWSPTYGASVRGSEVEFAVWAPRATKVDLLLGPGTETVAMEEREGVFKCRTHAAAGSRYLYRLGRSLSRPDPASLCQPEGVHGPSMVVDMGDFHWRDSEWEGVPLRDLVIYELHVGAFTAEGTFDAVVPRLRHLSQLGVTAVELMPVAQFPGSRDWGYDGVYPYAAQSSYGGPAGLARLVDACHSAGLAAILDVVYNHLGPEGNYLSDFGPYFSQRYRTPWGDAFNYDDAGSDHVRRYVVENALHWVRDFHFDGLRLDAVHGIFDSSPKHILREIAEEVRGAADMLGRKVHVIAESDLNDPRLVKGWGDGGYGLDAQWADDMHHCIHSVVTGEAHGYYQDFGRVSDLAAAFMQPFVVDGRYSSYRQRRHGASSAGLPDERFVVCSQNHDQVGNRPDGSRLAVLAGTEAAKAAAAAVVLSPYLPLLFMGEEYAERAPFLFFTDYGDERTARATREGRRRELEAQGGSFVDPQSPQTLVESRLNFGLSGSPEGREVLSYYTSLIGFRKDHPAVRADRVNSWTLPLEGERALAVRRWSEDEELLFFFAFHEGLTVDAGRLGGGRWSLLLSSRKGVPAALEGGTAASFPGPSASVYGRS